MKSSSCPDGSDHSCNEKGESSKNGEMRNTKPKDKKTCYHYGKLGKTTMVCKILNLCLLVSSFTTRNKDIRYKSVGQD